MPVECTPTSCQDGAGASSLRRRRTTGDPLLPRWVRESVRKQPCPWNRTP